MNVASTAIAAQHMQPLDSISNEALRSINYLLFDVDETFTTQGLLTSAAYASLFALRDAGIGAIPVTGRPSGWGNVMLSTWPIKACVTENGGVISWRDASNVSRQRIIHLEHRGAGYIEKLRALGTRIVAKYPMVRVSADQPYRLTDLAIDYAEQSRGVSESIVAEIVELMRDDGYITAVSSIHIHAYFPMNEKADGVYPLMQAAFDMSRADVHRLCAFIGDSPNDASLFASIPMSVGVQNIHAAINKMRSLPNYVCVNECGAGFVEFAQRLIASR
jgi:hydroxymethylpyrimidine pyrophosphatase-like HAD family hydrolase